MQTLLQQPLLLLLLLERRQKEKMNTSESKVQAFVTSKRLFFIPGFRVASFSQLSPAGWSMNR